LCTLYLHKMTYSLRNVVGVLNVHKGKEAPKGLVFTYDHWPYFWQKLYDYVLGCHLAHLLDFSCAFVCYILFYPSIITEAKEWHVNWIAKIAAYNFACEIIFYGFFFGIG